MSIGDSYPWERPLGARPVGDGQVEFRVWAPSADRIALVVGGEEQTLTDAGYGVYEAVRSAPPGADYWYLIDGERLPDPATRSQPDGLRGPSRVDDAPAVERFAPRPLREQVIYELHVGTFSPEGTFTGAIPYLDALAELGVTAIEVMPVAEFPGARGWGYDGVYISAAQSSYGGPDGFRALIDAAHARGLAVILDVVYNHVGPEGGGALAAFGPYFTDTYNTPWGEAVNYDGPGSGAVREWVCQSAEGWVRDFGVDGLRLDAIHAIFDASAENIVAEIARRVHAIDARALVIAESGLNDPRVMRPSQLGGLGCDAEWADDFHHALRTLITDEHDGYYAEFGHVAQLAKAFARPHVHDGVYSEFRGRRFGAPAFDLAPERFVVFSQDHDQVGNRAFGDRMPDGARPIAAFATLLSPFTPMLFMGEEYGEEAPFQYFTDHIDSGIAEATRKGRRAEFAAFASFGEEIPDPEAPETFEDSKLTRREQPAIAKLYRELLALRPQLPHGDADRIAFDEDERWLVVDRGPFELVFNFGSTPLTRPVPQATLRFATHPEVTMQDDRLTVCPLGAALLTVTP